MEPKIRKAKKETKRPDPKPEITDPITKEVANRHKDITELEIMQQPLKQITKNAKLCMQACPKLQAITLSGCSLVYLTNMPEIAELIHLDLSVNEIADSELKYLDKYTKLNYLSLAQNKITKLQSIKLLSPLTNLKRIELIDNQIDGLPDYHSAVFQVFPKLDLLDSFNREGNEVEVDNEDIELQDGSIDDGQDDQEEDEEESPEPKKHQKKENRPTQSFDNESQDEDFDPNQENEGQEGGQNVRFGIGSSSNEDDQEEGSEQEQPDFDDPSEESKS